MSHSVLRRREFISAATLGIAGAALVPKLRPFLAAADVPIGSPRASEDAALPMEKRLGVALVGLGKLSIEELIPAFRASRLTKLTALVSGNAAKAEKLARESGVKPEGVYNYENFDRIRDNDDVQIVYVVLPNSMHAEFTIRAAKAGKHVLCEKPMETSVAKCQAMIDACKAKNVKLMIAYRMQYEPMTHVMQRLVRDKVFGPAKFIEAAFATRLPSFIWRLDKEVSGSGAVGDLGIYCMNTIRYLLGEEPTEISAHAYRPSGDSRFAQVDATTIWQMQFPSGALANCACSYDSNDASVYRVIAERGTFGMEPAFLYRGLKMFARPNEPALPQIAETNQFANELDHMAECILQNREPYTRGEEGIQDLHIIEAILESARSRSTVKLPKADELDASRGSGPTR